MDLISKFLYGVALTELQSEDLLRHKWRGLPKLVAIVGGFLIMTGIVLLGIAALSLSGGFDVGMLLDRKYLMMFSFSMVAVGLLDFLSAIVIARW